MQVLYCIKYLVLIFNDKSFPEITSNNARTAEMQKSFLLCIILDMLKIGLLSGWISLTEVN